MSFDTIIRNGRWFDGTGAPSAVRNIGIRSGHVVAISPEPLDETDCPQVIDATDKWVMPGILDIHTHYDVEVLAGPSLSESLRHGVTTVMLGSCSLSTVHVGGVDAGDLFGRVEAIPRGHVIDVVDSHKTWTDCNGYVTALESLPLGPNLAAFIGHSDMRTAVMGLDRATRKDERPTAAEQSRMEQMLAEALDAGFVGMSSQQLLFDKIDGDTCRSRTLPSTYAKPRELRRLKSLLRRSGRVLQSGPDIQNPFNLVSQLAQSLGLFRSNLKTSLLSAADIKANPYSIAIMGPVARLVNKLGGNFRWQHLPVPFEVYADGIDLVVFEEFGSGAAALHLRDELERNELLRDEEYRRKFRKDYDNKFGVRVWHRDFFDARSSPVPTNPWSANRSAKSGRSGANCTRSTPSWTWCSSTAPRCGGAPRSPTTGRRCSRSWPAIPGSSSGSPTPARTCATWRSTTWDYGCFGTCATPSGRARRSCRSNRPCTGSPASSPTGTASMPVTCASGTAPTW
ncbi:D-amino acid aminohydrolase [Mycolicibacterium conceptionense]|uniref:D-amino acid aminohydrolase n=1 Tax=Mycolicibacterium conceptionense TaxID=451644 RepID=A0A0U1DMC4_9MYCO|nr:D-amino acid aminohydrolase [Mycolicibacterium conceptionense]